MQVTAASFVLAEFRKSTILEDYRVMNRPSVMRQTTLLMQRICNGALAVMLIVASAADAAPASKVRVTQGTVAGAISQGVESFLGIPYGASPAGINRWRAPQPAPGWKHPRAAVAFGPSCQQEISSGFGPYTQEYLVAGPVSEDCLSLNVWRPAAMLPTARLPVLVWIHGGGFASGSGAVPVYDGAGLARKGVIVITVNYRLGVFGFLAHPELTRAEGSSGNYGIQDIVLALHWVKDNVSAFGGDPARVTVAGQSAGSMAIHDLMVSPQAKGLFQQVISESGPGIGHAPSSLRAAESTGQKLVAAAHVSSVAELRRVPVAELENAVGRLRAGLFGFAPVTDGRWIPSDPYRNVPGSFIDTPILAGMNADEAFEPLSEGAAAAAARRTRKERGLASTEQWARARSHASQQPIYLYIFDHVEPGAEAWGTFHSSEIPYVLGTLDASKARAFTVGDRTLSAQVSSYWVNFIKTGNPNARGLPTWPHYHAADPRIMELGNATRSVPLLDAPTRRFYDTYVQQGGVLSLF